MDCEFSPSYHEISKSKQICNEFKSSFEQWILMIKILIKVTVVSLQKFSLKGKKLTSSGKLIRPSDHQHQKIFFFWRFQKLFFNQNFSFKLESSTTFIEKSSFFLSTLSIIRELSKLFTIFPFESFITSTLKFSVKLIISSLQNLDQLLFIFTPSLIDKTNRVLMIEMFSKKVLFINPTFHVR